MSLGHSSNIHEPKPGGGSGGGGDGANLTYSRNSTSVTVISDTGTDAALPAADTTNAGVMSAAQVQSLTNLAAGGIVAGTNVTLSGTWPNQTVNATGGGSSLTVQDEGGALTTAATTLNFTGAGVTASGTGAVKTINIPGAGSATVTVSENGTPVSAAISTLDFLGADFDVTESPAGEANIVIASTIARTAAVQPLDATLTALAGLTIAANSLSVGSGTDAFTQTTFAANTFPGRSSTGNLVAKTITDAGFALLDDADAAAMRTTLGLVIGTNVQAYDADLAAFAAKTAPTGAVVGDSDTQTLSGKTLTAPIISGIASYDGANVTTANAVTITTNAGTINTTKGLNTASNAADTTYSFSGAPATANTWFQLAHTNTDTAAHIINFPSSFSLATNGARTYTPVPASGRLVLTFRYDGSGYWVFGDNGFLNNFTATTNPGVGDDLADGFGTGSLWYNATANTLYFCETAGAGAAVWTNVTGGAGGGDMVLASTQTVTGEKTFNSSMFKMAGSTSGAITVNAPAVAGTGTVTMPGSGTLGTLAGSETLTNKTLTAPVVTSPLLALAALPGTNNTYEGTAITGRNAGATLTQWQAVYLDSSGTWQLADADGSGTFPCRGLAVAGYASAAAATVLDNGVARNDSWTWTIGGDVYLSTTAGGLTQTAPSTSGSKVQKIGYALTADSIRVNIGSGEYLTVT